jgi:cytochrome P450
MILFIFIFARIAIRCTLYWRMMKREGCQASCKKAYVRDPFIGLDFAYDRLFHGSPARNLKGSLEMYKRLGSTYTVNRLTTQTIYTCDVGNIKHLLATRFDDYKLPAVRVSVMGDLLGPGIFTLNGHSWSSARSLLRPALKKERLYGLSNILERHIQSMLGQISSQGGSLDLQPLFFSLTMDVATEFLMGYSTNMLNNPDGSAQQFVDDYMVCSTEAARKMTLGPLQFLRFNSAAKQSKARVFKYIDDYIEKCLKQTETGNSTVEQSNLLQELSGAIKDRKMLRDQVLHILLASRDTTASLLSNLFFVLARMPDVYAKLRSEIVAVVGDSVPDFGQLKELQYLGWCINECEYLRWTYILYSVTPYFMLINFPSIASSPRHPFQCSRGSQRYSLTCRRRTRRQLATLCQAWHNCSVPCLFDASRSCGLRQRCGGVQAGTLEWVAAGMGFLAIQRWAESVHRA